MKHRIRRPAAGLLCILAAALLSGCRGGRPIWQLDSLTGESYPNAEAYRVGAVTYRADTIRAVEVYWRSGAVELAESDAPELTARESGNALSEDAAMHTLLEDGVLRIRFCASGRRIRVNAAKKRLHLEVPEGIDLSIHTTSAPVRAEALNLRSLLIAALSGKTELGAVTAQSATLTSSSGSIHAVSVSAPSIVCSTSSGGVQIGALTAETARIATSSGSVRLALLKTPSAEIRTSSGGIQLALPESGAEVAYTTSSGRLRTERTYARKGDLYVFGPGECRLTAETASGNLEIS